MHALDVGSGRSNSLLRTLYYIHIKFHLSFTLPTMDISGAQTQTNNQVEYSLQRHEWCSCNKCRRSSDDGTGKYIYFKTFHSHKHEYKKKRNRNKRDYPELEDKGYQQTVWLRRAVPHSGKRSRGNQNRQNVNRDDIQGYSRDGNENMPANVMTGSPSIEYESQVTELID